MKEQREDTLQVEWTNYTNNSPGDPSEPFEVIGKIIPRYENENWTFTELLYEAPYLKSYQDEEDEEDEEADCLEYIDNTDKIIYLLYRRYRRM